MYYYPPVMVSEKPSWILLLSPLSSPSHLFCPFVPLLSSLVTLLSSQARLDPSLRWVRWAWPLWYVLSQGAHTLPSLSMASSIVTLYWNRGLYRRNQSLFSWYHRPYSPEGCTHSSYHYIPLGSHPWTIGWNVCTLRVAVDWRVNYPLVWILASSIGNFAYSWLYGSGK